MLAISSRLGPYQIVAPIGAGGMGEVYRARDTRLGREVAVKVLLEHFAGHPDRRARFEREARAVAALSHPNILAIHDYGTEGAVTYAVMELLEGETLRSRLGRGPLPWREAVDIGAAVADGLAAAHAKGIVHRDLKPENLFLTADGRVKILDFGLARITPLADAQSATASYVPAVTDLGAVMGTVGYMSPEQVRGQPADAPSDLFSLGCVLYEMVTGQRAFRRETAAETMTAILHDEPPALSDSGDQVPTELGRLIRQCLAKNPSQRLHSARDLALALRATASHPGPHPAAAGEAAMFRVVGRDARGRRREISVHASTEEDARLIALSSGSIATIDQVTIPPPVPPSRLSLRRSAFGVSSCVLFGVVLLFFVSMALIHRDLKGGGIGPERVSGLGDLIGAVFSMIGLGCGGIAVSVVGLCLGFLGVAFDERKMAARVGAALHGLVIALAGCLIGLGR